MEFPAFFHKIFSSFRWNFNSKCIHLCELILLPEYAQQVKLAHINSTLKKNNTYNTTSSILIKNTHILFLLWIVIILLAELLASVTFEIITLFACVCAWVTVSSKLIYICPQRDIKQIHLYKFFGAFLCKVLLEQTIWININMNPYYDPEWSVLPPEHNRRYVMSYKKTTLCMYSVSMMCTEKTVNFGSSVIWKSTLKYLHIETHCWLFFSPHFCNKWKSIFYLITWQILCYDRYNWLVKRNDAWILLLLFS